MELLRATRSDGDADVDDDAVYDDRDDDGDDDGTHSEHLYTYHPFHRHPPWSSHRHLGNCYYTYWFVHASLRGPASCRENFVLLTTGVA